MSLIRLSQQLRRGLKASAADVEQSCVDLGKLVKKLSDANTIALMGLEGHAENTRNIRTPKVIDRNIAPIDSSPFQVL